MTTSFLKFSVRNVPASIQKALGGFATNGVAIRHLNSLNNDLESPVQEIIVGVDGDARDDGNKPLQIALEELVFFSGGFEVLAVKNNVSVLPTEIRLLNLDLTQNSFKFAAAHLYDQISTALQLLRENKPNDDEGYQCYERLVDFYENTLQHMARIVDAKEDEAGRAIVQSESQKLFERVHGISERLSKSARMQSLIDTSLIGGCYAYLAICGMPAAFAAPTAVAAFAGPKLLGTIRKLIIQK